MKKLFSFFFCLLCSLSIWAGTNLFDANQASVASTWGAGDVNPTATWENSTLTITLNAAQPNWQWGNQVAFLHNVTLENTKWYKVSYTLRANAYCGGVTFKMDDNNGWIYENQTINLVANTDYNYEKVVKGVTGGNNKIVWDFGYGVQNTQITMTNFSVEETTAPVIDYFSGTATASSNNDNAYLSADGNTGTRWASANDDGDEIFWQRNYDDAQTFDRIKITWEGAYGKSFKIQTCNSKDEGWTDIATVTDQTLNSFPYVQTIVLANDVTAKHVRFQGVKKATGYGYSFWEFETYKAQTSVLTSLDFSAAAAVCKLHNTVALTATPKDQYNVAMEGQTITYQVSPSDAGHVTDGVYTADAAGLATITATCGSLSKQVSVFNYTGDNVALNKSVTGESTVNAATRVNDGDDATEYQVDPNNGGSSQDITCGFIIDLGAKYDLNMIAIHFEGACSDAYTIQTSDDNTTWNSAYSFSGTLGNSNHTDYIYGSDFTNNSAVRYIKFTSTKNATQWGMKIYEFQAFGTEIPDTRAASDLTITSASSVSIDLADDSHTSQISYTSSVSGGISYSSDNTSVATVSTDGLITAVGKGTAIITISQAATDDYKAGSQTVNVTVTNSNAVLMNFGSAGHFATPNDKKVFYQFFYADGKLSVKLNSLTGNALDFAELQIENKGNYAMTKDGNGYTYTLDVTEGTDLYIRLLYSDTEMPGNEMTAENLSSTDAHIIHWAATSVALPATVKDTNFALATNGASASATSGTASRAIDGDNGSRWESAYSDPQDFILNMGQRRLFNTIQIRWQTAYTKTFDLLLSDDGENWATVKSVSRTISNMTDGYEENIDLGFDVAAQYIKFHGTDRATQWGHSFFELRVLYPANSVLTVFNAVPASNTAKVNATNAITLTIQDQNGKTMDADVTYEVIPADAGAVSNNVYTPAKAGNATITATAKQDAITLTSSFDVFAYAGENLAKSESLAASKIIAQSNSDNVTWLSGSAYDAFFTIDGNDGSIYQGSIVGNTGADEASRTYDSWFVIDLDDFYSLELVTIHFEGACSQNYTVQVSNDNVNWTTAYTYAQTKADIYGHTDLLYSATAQKYVTDNQADLSRIRYVKFYSTKAATQYGMKIYEMQVFGTPAPSAVLSVSEAGYATYFNSQKAYIMPEGMTGYIFEKTERKIVETYPAGSAVPAGEALVLKADEGDYTLEYTTTGSEKSTENALLGTDGPVQLPDNDEYYFYALSLNAQNDLNSIGLYWMNEDGSAFMNGAHKAYLMLPKYSTAPSHFLFEDSEETATSLSAADNATAAEKFLENGQLFIRKNGQVYNALGQEVK